MEIQASKWSAESSKAHRCRNWIPKEVSQAQALKLIR